MMKKELPGVLIHDGSRLCVRMNEGGLVVPLRWWSAGKRLIMADLTRVEVAARQVYLATMHGKRKARKARKAAI